MFKLFLRNLSALRYSVGTLVLILIPIGYYFLFHVPAQEDYLHDRALRLLGDVSERTAARAKAMKSLIDTRLIKSKLLASELSNSVAVAAKSLEWEVTDIQGFELDRNSIRIAPAETVPINQLSSTNQRVGESTITFRTEGALGQAKLHLAYRLLVREASLTQSRLGGTVYDVSFEGSVDIAALLAPFIPPEIFDNLLILDYGDTSRVVYQQVQDEFLAARLDTADNPLHRKRIGNAADVTWGNVPYKLYLQPIRIPHIQQPYATDIDYDWALIGLVATDRFRSQARSISHFQILLFIFLIILFFLSLPLLKLRFFGSREELRLGDVVFAVFSLLIGTSILTFLLLSVHSNVRDRGLVDNSGLLNLASEVENTVNVEIDSLIAQIKYFEDGERWLEAPTEGKGFKVANVLEWLNTSPAEARQLPYPYFRQVFWMDSTGQQIGKASADSSPTPLVNLKHREYFGQIAYGQGWPYDSETDFHLEPIISVTDGSSLAVLSMTSSLPGASVAAISSRFMSLFDVVIPEGFGFCIIDEDGNVLFHHRTNKNLQENFYTECNDDKQLISAVLARQARAFTVNYLGRNHRLFVKPFERIPSWRLVAFADSQHINRLQMNSVMMAMLAFTAIILTGVVLFFVLKLLVTVLGALFGNGDPENKRLNTITSWIVPKQERNSAYHVCIVVFPLITGFLYALIFRLNSYQNFYLAWMLPFASLAIMYMYFRWIFPTTRKYVRLSERHAKTFIFGRIVKGVRRSSEIVENMTILTVGLVVLADLVWDFLPPEIYYPLLVSTLGVVLASDRFCNRIARDKFPPYYIRYVESLCILLLLVSMLPAIALFKSSYDQEMTLLVKHGQLSLRDGLEDRNKQVADYYRHHPFGANDSLQNALVERRQSLREHRDVYSEFFYATAVNELPGSSLPAAPASDIIPDTTSVSESPPTFYKRLRNFFVNALATARYHIRIRLGIVAPQYWDLEADLTNDAQWQWDYAHRGQLLGMSGYIESSNKPFRVQSALGFFPRPVHAVWYLGTFLLFLLSFWLIYYLISKVFMLRLALPHLRTRSQGNGATERNTLFIGPPNTGKTEFVTQRFPTLAPLDLSTLDDPNGLRTIVTEITKREDSDRSIVILEQFDHHLFNEGWNRARLEVLEELIIVKKRHVLCVCTHDLTRFTSVLSSETLDTGVKELNTDLKERWEFVLSSFVKAYHQVGIEDGAYVREFSHKLANLQNEAFNEINASLTKQETAGTLSEKQRAVLLRRRQLTLDIGEAIAQHCSHTKFLQEIGIQLYRQFDFDKNEHWNSEAIIRAIVHRAESHFRTIWRLCSVDEQITLYYLARNGFVPPKVADILSDLLRKGLVIKDPTTSLFKVFNQAFREFIVQAPTEEDLRDWKSEQVGGWDDIRRPLIIVIIAVALFVFITQQETFNETLAWLSAVATSLPILLKLFEMLRSARVVSSDGT